jgi:hypothetical protein
MRKRILFIILCIVTFLFGYGLIFAAGTDQFVQLESLSVGAVLPDTITSLGQKQTLSLVHKDVYTFDSSLYSNPHVIYVENGTISFIQLTIPAEKQDEYNKQYNSYPTSERVVLPKTKSEILVGFPSRGIAYIINGYAGSVIRFQKFPVKSVADFTNQEGRNFRPIVTISPNTPTPSTVVKVSKNFSLFTQVYTPIFGVVSFLVLVILGVIFWRTRKNRMHTSK